MIKNLSAGRVPSPPGPVRPVPASGQDIVGHVGQAGLEAVEVAGFRDITEPPPDWAGRAQVVERELHRRYGHAPELTTADEQSDRSAKLLSSGQLTTQVILLRTASPAIDRAVDAAERRR